MSKVNETMKEEIRRMSREVERLRNESAVERGIFIHNDKVYPNECFYKKTLYCIVKVFHFYTFSA